MTTPDQERRDPDAGLPSAVPVRRRALSLSAVWLIPLVAALLGGWLVWKHLSETGPLISIRFETADGLEAGKTKVKFKDVVIGLVEGIELTPDRSDVVVKARMEPYVSGYLVEDSRFWVERPRIRGTSVQGLGTLLSGAFINMDVGKSKQRKSQFTGLEKPPVITSDLPGRQFHLVADGLGSIDVGVPVYYRRMEVGRVYQYEMDKDGKAIHIGIFIDAPYDRYVSSATRFWETSGFDLRLDANGVRLDTQSLNSVLSGGVAFQNPGQGTGARVADAGATFKLYKNQDEALSFDEQDSAPFVLRFDQSLRGLSPGAPVDLLGMSVGKVTDIYPMYDEKKKSVYMMALIDLYPGQLAKVRTAVPGARQSGREGLDSLVEGGLRAQLRTGNLVTGQLYVSFDFFRDAPRAVIDWRHDPPRLPTTPGTLAGIEDGVAEIVQKLRKLPLDKLGEDLRQALGSLDQTLQATGRLAVRLEQDVAPEAKAALTDFRATLLKLDRSLNAAEQALSPDGGLQRQMLDTLREVARASASMRDLSETLELRPESVLRGKVEELQHAD